MPPKRARRYVSSDENERGAEEWPERRADAAEDGGEGEADGEVDREDVERVHEADVLRPEGAGHRGERGADRDGRHLEPQRRDAERQGGVLVLAHRRELVAASRALEVELDQVETDREHEDDGDPDALVRDAERPEPRPKGHGDALGAGGEAAPAAGDDQQHLRERDRGEDEVRDRAAGC